LLDQTIVAGLGNYLRAEIMFEAKLNPWRTVASLSPEEIAKISYLVPTVTARAYEHEATVTDASRDRMRQDHTLVYVPGKEYGTRHHVFRRTNLPCLVCGTPIRQMRQETGPLKTDLPGEAEQEDEEDKTRIVYFCPTCQQVDAPAKPTRPRKPSGQKPVGTPASKATRTASKPTAKSKNLNSKSAAKPVAQPVNKKAAKKPSVKLTSRAVATPVSKPTAKPAAKATAKPIAKPNSSARSVRSQHLN
jgi:hypothetical protein